MNGLSSAKADELLEQYGLNIITEQKKKPFILKFIEQFNNFLTILLIFAAFFSFFIKEPVDGSLIISIVILNAIFGLYQEKKAEEAIASLQNMAITKIRVIRDGKQTEIDSRYLVPEDVIFIEEGAKIPADAKIVEAMNLEVNEAVLTGESLPVAKNLNDAIFMGTVVARGRGFAKITKTGMQSKFGSIATHLSEIEDTATPLQKKLASLTRIIGILGIIIALTVFVLSFLEGSGYFPAFLLAISLAVAVVPEGLPAVMTITLAMGVSQMAKKKAIVKKLAAIEGLGSITLIATDKTGTLTTNKMKVKEVFIDSNLYEEKNLPKLANHPFNLMVLDGILCSTASLVEVTDHERYDVLGDPTEGALLYLAQKTGLVPDMVRNEWKIIAEKPFDSVSKMMSVIVQNQKSKIKNQNFCFSKGAPESILALCDKVQRGRQEAKLSWGERERITKQIEVWTRKGLRVLAFAYKKTGTRNSKLETNPNLKIVSDFGFSVPDLTLLGMVAIHDAPRPEAVEAVSKAKEAGIKVVMITGDNEKTAEAVGISSGIVEEGAEILTGQQIDNYSDPELLKLLPRVKIFARTTPFHKHRIVKLFQELGEVVAVTGDGVNDAIALKQADVGIAMGLIGTDVVRETADMVITDDNFATIVDAVEEGRNIIKNLKNAIKYLLSCNIAEALSLLIGLFLGLPTLFYPIQLLYINLITDGVPALALAFSPRTQGVMKDSPEKELTLLPKRDQIYIFLVGLSGTILVLVSFQIFQTAGKTAAFSVLTLIQSFIFIDLWLSHRSVHKNLRQLKSPFFLAAFVLPFVFQYLIVGTALGAKIFKVPEVSFATFGEFLAISALVLVGVKVTKAALRFH